MKGACCLFGFQFSSTNLPEFACRQPPKGNPTLLQQLLHDRDHINADARIHRETTSLRSTDPVAPRPIQVFSMCIAESGGHLTVGGQNRLGSLRNDMSSPPVLMWFAIPFGYSNSWGPTTQGRRASCTNILIHWFASAVNLTISEVSRSSTSRCDCLGGSSMSVAQMDVTLAHAAPCNAECRSS